MSKISHRNVANDTKTEYKVNRQKRKSTLQIHLRLAITQTRIRSEISRLMQNSLPHY